MQQPQKFGSTPTVGLTIITLILGAAATWVTGVTQDASATWVTGVTQDASAPSAAAAPVAAPAAHTAVLTGVTSPAKDVIATLIGPAATWGAKVPAPFGCTTTPAVLSASTPTISAHAYQAGSATTALDRLARCGHRTTVNGTPGVVMTSPGGVVIAWTRGDILATISGPVRDDTAPAALDARLVELLNPVCLSLAPTLADAERNPASVTYQGYATTEQVTIPEAPTPAPVVTPTPEPSSPLTPAPTPTSTTPTPAPVAVTLTQALPAPVTVKIPTIPTGIAGPPLPAARTAPAAPTAPAAQVTSTTITITMPDPDGPGCGWTFTGQTPPQVNTTDLQARADATRTAAHTDLLIAQQQWTLDASNYLTAATTYLTTLTAWATYANDVTTTAAAWQTQADALTAYTAATTTYTAAITARDNFLTQQAAALALYNQQVATCRNAPTPTPTPTPSPTPTPPPTTPPTTPPTVLSGTTAAPTCELTRPAILDQIAPPTPTAPTPPTLWTQP